MKKLMAMAMAGMLALSGCGKAGDGADGSRGDLGYRQISQDEAAAMMEQEDGHIILDVRRQDEFQAGHIPGAVCIPNEEIGTVPPAELPDLDQVILVYCRSGNRSKQAAEKLSAMGYINIYEFGGIMTWTGETVTGEAGAHPEEK